MILKDIIDGLAVLNQDVVLNIYQYGSRVYNCATNNSDYDFVIIVQGSKSNYQIHTGEIELSVYGEIEFQQMINEHEISALECLFLPQKFIIKETKKFDFNLDLNILRSSLSKKSSNSWAKAGKKLTIEEDFNIYIAKKSLFHSLRIIYFGIQLAMTGKIINYEEANYLLYEILDNPSENWLDYKEKYQSFYNELRSQFRLKCPK